MRPIPRALLAAALILGLTATAHANGASPKPPGDVGALCGTIAGLTCAKDLWCDPEPNRCTGADIAGTCVRATGYCTRDYRPVCGCDGKTYSNDCTRRAERVAKRHDGKCEG